LPIQAGRPPRPPQLIALHQLIVRIARALAQVSLQRFDFFFEVQRQPPIIDAMVITAYPKERSLAIVELIARILARRYRR
jgi:hypothetical protein